MSPWPCLDSSPCLDVNCGLVLRTKGPSSIPTCGFRKPLFRNGPLGIHLKSAFGCNIQKVDAPQIPFGYCPHQNTLSLEDEYVPWPNGILSSCTSPFFAGIRKSAEIAGGIWGPNRMVSESNADVLMCSCDEDQAQSSDSQVVSPPKLEILVASQNKTRCNGLYCPYENPLQNQE